MNDSVLLKLCGNSDYLMLRPVSRENAGKRKNFFAARSLLLRLENESEVILNDGTDLAIFRRSAIETGVNVLTAIDTAEALVTSMENTDRENLTLVDIAKIRF